jgi:3-phosphoshikimate 1-carboxyvinyltransferase
VDEIEITALDRPLDAAVRVPGSKSITNRALLLAAMARGRTTIESALFSDDTNYMVGALNSLGLAVQVSEAHGRITVDGRGGIIPAASADLFVGNAGTAMRFLAGFLTLGRGRFRLDGDARMRERPVGELLDALESLGVHAFSERNNRCPPIVIEPTRPCEGGAAAIDASLSSQFVSAILMPAPLWKRGLKLALTGAVARPFIEMTRALMKEFGATSTIDKLRPDSIVVPGGQRYRSRTFAVEPDASSASYFAAAAALCGGVVRIEELRADSVQGDIGFFKVLEQMGAEVKWRADGVEVRGDGRLRGVDIDMAAMPDMAATLAALAPFASSPTAIRKVAFIRHHESDRIHALATELGRLGAKVRELDDGLAIQPSKLRPAAIETYGDHRIAMSFAIVGLKVKGVRIKDPGCVAKTFPDFFDRLKHLR